MKSNVSYPKEMRDKAAAEQQGLYTIDLMNGSKQPGKFGTRMTLQSISTFADNTAVFVAELRWYATSLQQIPFVQATIFSERSRRLAGDSFHRHHAKLRDQNNLFR